MENEENVVADNSNTVEEEIILEEQNIEEEKTEESVEELKARLAKAEEIANNQKIRAEKAERKAKEIKPESKQDLSTTDLYALMTAKVHQDDIAEVTDYAKLKNISVQEALKSSVVKSILKDKEEERNVSLATNTGGARRSVTKISDEVLQSKASKGELPESEDDIQRLVKARLGIKK